MQLPLRRARLQMAHLPIPVSPSAESVMTILVEEGTSLPLFLLVNALAFYVLQ